MAVLAPALTTAPTATSPSALGLIVGITLRCGALCPHAICGCVVKHFVIRWAPIGFSSAIITIITTGSFVCTLGPSGGRVLITVASP